MSTSSAATISVSVPAKICFNPSCKEARSEGHRKKGWRLRSGEIAELCDRCSTLYEQGSFCETFHADADGWRKCESCGKRVHCGCIVSASSFVLLDGGGIQCMPCAQKHFVPVQNQMWPSSSLLFPIQSERIKELPGKSWNQLTSTSPVPGQWRPAPNAWSAAVAAQSDLHQRLSYEFDRPSSIEKLFSTNRLALSEKKKVEDLAERPATTNINRAAMDRIVNGNSTLKPPGYAAFHRDESGNSDGSQSSHLVGDHEAIPTRKLIIQGSRLSSSSCIKLEAVPSPCSNISPGSALLKDDSTAAVIGLGSPFSSSVEGQSNDPSRLSINPAHRQAAANSFGKQLCPNSSNLLDANGESQNLMRNGRPRMEGRGRSQLLPRYWPRITDQELQQISGDSNSVITPLFQKMLSASDAGRIGRLVLPKKCAEAYFPAISQPEGLPLKVQDATGKEWVFQFRFWPNNNSRMYVLEGVTPCIQSMQLQAGDTVTFSRIDPEGKLVMGFRKASNSQAEQVGNGFSTTADVNNKSNKQNDISSPPLRPLKGNSESFSSNNSTDQVTWPKNDKEGFIQKEGNAPKPGTIPNKRKSSSTLGSKSKRLRIENEDSIELKLTWEVAQELLRPPPNHAPSIVVIDGHEIEEYEEAPVLGKPTIFTANPAGGKDQWAQCEDCLKWRKLPVDALLPPRWTCSDNSWDPERSSCSAAQEITIEQLADMLPFNTVGHKKNKSKAESNVIEGSDGLDTLANLAILGEGESLSSSQPTTRHPRHRPGCTCIVCIQPPSGKGPKHKQSCTCNVCLTVKRRFRTLMLRKEKRQSEKEAETARKKQQQQQQPTNSPDGQIQQEDSKPAASKISSSQSKKPMASADAAVDEETDKKKDALLSVKTEIDLNMQPEREEEPSPVADASHAILLLQSATS